MNTDRRNGPLRILASVLLVVCLAGAAFLGYLAWSELAQRKQSRDYYREMSAEKMYVSETVPSAETQQTEPETEPTEPPRRRPAGTGESVMDFSALQESYPRCVGWLEIDGIGVDLPVMQGLDNIFYLNHLADGTENPCGAIMMDAACEPDFSCDMTVIHGHNLQNGTMFGSLAKFGNPDFFAANPDFRLYTPGGDYKVEILAAYTASEAKFGYPTWFETPEELSDFLETVRQDAGCVRDIEVLYGDRLMVLSTCAYDFQDARFVVVGKLT